MIKLIKNLTFSAFTVFAGVFFLLSTVMPAYASSYDHRWLYRSKITISGYDRAETLTNFPLLIQFGPNIPGFSYSQLACPANGADLRLTTIDEAAEFAYEIEQWNTNADYTTTVPSSIAGCTLWLRADAGVLTNTTGVTTWYDQSGANFHATTVSGAEPDYIADELNGHPVIRFDGVTNYLRNTSWAPNFFATGEMTYFFVSKIVLPSTGSGFFAQRPVSGLNDHNDPGGLSIEQVGGLNRGVRYYRNGNPSIDVYRGNFQFKIDVIRVDAYGTQTYLNGLPQGSSNTSFASALIPNEYVIGARALTNGVVSFGKVDFAEIIIYNTALDSNHLMQVGVYLSEKYGMTTAYKRPGLSSLWVLIPELTNSLSMWAYWGNPAATNPPASTTNRVVWNSNYRAVWHMGETNVYDYTTNMLVGNAYTNANVEGVIGGAQNFAGNGCVDLAYNSVLNISGPLTVSSWLYHNSGNGWSFAYSSGIAGGGWVCDLGLTSNNWWGGELKGHFFGPASVPQSREWHYQVTVYDISAGRIYLYHDGERVTEINASGNITVANQFNIARKHDGGLYWGGLIDEMRLSAAAASSNWVWASYLSQLSNQVFNTYGTVEMTKRGTVIRIH